MRLRERVDLRHVLNELHTQQRKLQVLADADDAVTIKEQRIIVFDQLPDGSCTGSPKRQREVSERHLQPDRDDRLGQERREALPGARHRRGVGRMSVHDGTNVRSLSVGAQMQSKLRWGPRLTFSHLALLISNGKPTLTDICLRQRCGSHQKASLAQTGRDVAVMVRHPAVLVQRMRGTHQVGSKLSSISTHGRARIARRAGRTAQCF